MVDTERLGAEAAHYRNRKKDADDQLAALAAQLKAEELKAARYDIVAKHPHLSEEFLTECAPAGLDADALKTWADTVAPWVKGARPAQPQGMTALTRAALGAHKHGGRYAGSTSNPVKNAVKKITR